VKILLEQKKIVLRKKRRVVKKKQDGLISKKTWHDEC
jgi:hypothetical protein